MTDSIINFIKGLLREYEEKDGGGSVKVIRSFQTTAGQMIMKL